MSHMPRLQNEVQKYPCHDRVITDGFINDDEWYCFVPGSREANMSHFRVLPFVINTFVLAALQTVGQPNFLISPNRLTLDLFDQILEFGGL